MWKSCGQTVEVFHNSQNIHDPATKSRRANEKSSYFSDSFLSETHFLKKRLPRRIRVRWMCNSDTFVSDTFLSVNFTHWTHIWHKYLTLFGDFWVFFSAFFLLFSAFFVISCTAFWIFEKNENFSKSWRVLACFGVLWRVFLCYNRATSWKEGLVARKIQQKGVVKLIYWVWEQPRARRCSL